MEFADLIRTRESIRNYDPGRPVPKEILLRILEAARLAPSANNCQPWKLILVSSPLLLTKIKACYNREWLKDACHILVAIGLNEKAWKRRYDGYNSVETDVAIALTHIILAAENEGVSTCWIAAFDPSLLKEVLETKEGEVIYGIMPLGYPKPGFIKADNKKRKNLAELVEFR